MVTKTSAVLTSEPLRRRMNILRGPHSTHALHLSTADSLTSTDSKGLSAVSAFEPEYGLREEKQPSSPSDYGTGSDMSDAEQDERPPGAPKNPKDKESPKRPRIDTANLQPAKERPEASPMTPKTRAWYEFDLAVVVALVSPIGNWLTGGDHVKNMLLLILLIFYLHQIIEVPWELYQKARPRRRAPNLPGATLEDRYKNIACSELRHLEVFFLALATISPFLGASLLRYATAAIMGEEAVSWFSTALFVLATGMRPWSHIVDRFTQRTMDLHDVVHYPSPNKASEDDVRQQLEEMVKRVEHLERSLAKARAKIIDTTEEVYEYVDEAVNAVDRTVRRHERKSDKQEIKVKELELVVEALKSKSKSKNSTLTINTSPAARPSLISNFLPAWLVPPPHRNYYGPPTYSPSSSKHSLRSFPSSSSIQLETIPEEETSKYPLLAQPANLPSLVLSRAGYLVTLPLRAVIRMILRRY